MGTLLDFELDVIEFASRLPPCGQSNSMAIFFGLAPCQLCSLRALLEFFSQAVGLQD